MPSFFSKKTRSQPGPAGEESPLSASHPLSSDPAPPAPAPAPGPPGPPGHPAAASSPYEQHFYQQHPQQLEQQQHTPSSSSLGQFRRPSVPVISASQFQNYPAQSHNSFSAGVGLRYAGDLPLDNQQEQQPPHQPQQQQQLLPQQQQLPPAQLQYQSQPQPQQQQQQHHDFNQPPSHLDRRSTINLVTQQQQQQSYQSSPHPDSQNSAGQLWSTTHPNVTAQDQTGKSTKLHKRKGLFSRNQSVASSSPGKQQTRPEKGLGRSVSVKHTIGHQQDPQPQQQQHQQQQEQLQQQQSPPPPQAEHGRVGGIHTKTNPQSSSSSSTRLDTEIQSRSTEEHSPGSPLGVYESSVPQTPIPSQSFSDLGYHHQLHHPRHHIWQQHNRAESLDSIADQAPSRRPSVQQSSLNNPASSSGSDMASTDRQPQHGGSQLQVPARKDSLAAPSGQGMSQAPSPHLQSASSGPLYKGNASSQQNLHDASAQGRETPPANISSSKLREELESLDVAALILKHEELQAKYQKVKRYYFDKEAQVTQLQNTVAHQRMAVSRTVLDDNEYTARFNRLDGAIKELSFSIRKEWKSIPEWLHPYVNEDALTLGTKEMTGVGRAVISRWVVAELFNRYFHPGLEHSFSERLKNVELNLRQQQVQVFNDDDKENQVARISNWRRTTLDGLAVELQSRITAEYQAQLTEYLIEKLSTTLQCYLNESATPELARYTQTIVENAVNIAEKIPQESRDIIVDYVASGTPISETTTTLKIETGLPPLTRPIGAEAKDSPSSERGEGNDDMEIDSKDAASNNNLPDYQQNNPHNNNISSSSSNNNNNNNNNNSNGGNGNNSSNKSSNALPLNREQRKKYPFGSLMGKKSSSSNHPPPQSSDASTRSSSGPLSSPSSENNNNKDGTERDDQQQQQLLLQQNKPQNEKKPRVRFATFMSVEVRGRGPNNVLIQAPVYTIEP